MSDCKPTEIFKASLEERCDSLEGKCKIIIQKRGTFVEACKCKKIKNGEVDARWDLPMRYMEPQGEKI